MHVSDHSRVASLLFFYRVIRSGFLLLIAVEQRILQVRVVLCCPFELRPSRCVIYLQRWGIGQRTEKERVPAYPVPMRWRTTWTNALND